MTHQSSFLERYLAKQLQKRYMPPPQREYQFCEERKWRFDFAWPEIRFAVECDGGQFKGKGGHQTSGGYQSNREKDNAAQMMGWIVLRFTTKMIRTGHAAEFIEKALIKRALMLKVDI